MIGLSILVLIVMISATREFVNYNTIQTNIDYQKQQQQYRSEKIAFEKNFLIPYLESKSALFFYEHENSILKKNEYVIHRQEPTIPQKNTIISKEKVEARGKAWKLFLEEKWQYILAH